MEGKIASPEIERLKEHLTRLEIIEKRYYKLIDKIAERLAVDEELKELIDEALK